MNELEWTKKLYHLVDRLLGDGTVKIGRERRLWDRTRVDLLTEDWALEVDWAPKWAEAIGQACWYAETTNRKPGVVLLVKNFDKEAKYIYRCKVVCTKLGFAMWLVDTAKG